MKVNFKAYLSMTQIKGPGQGGFILEGIEGAQ